MSVSCKRDRCQRRGYQVDKRSYPIVGGEWLKSATCASSGASELWADNGGKRPFRNPAKLASMGGEQHFSELVLETAQWTRWVPPEVWLTQTISGRQRCSHLRALTISWTCCASAARWIRALAKY